ncbi:MAG: PTS sugar transporter subunit IIA [Hungatella hathewayi]|nr:PTS sugar transporter subunit IIA [Hungatella hathewayi]
MLTEILTKDLVRLDVEGLETPEEVIRYSGQLLKDAGKVRQTYVDKMVEAFKTIGPYIVMAPGIAMPHARPSGDVLQPCVSFLRLKKPIRFGHSCNDPVKLVFALGGVADDSHIDLIRELGRLLEKDDNRRGLLEINSYEDFKKMCEEAEL